MTIPGEQTTAAAPTCTRCHAVIAVDSAAAKQLADLGPTGQGALICPNCAAKLGLSEDLYGVNAGYLYQRFNTFWLRLWPVGTFHI